MRKLLYLLFFGLVGFFLFWQKDQLVTNTKYLFQTPCDEPIAYRIGQVDPGYGKSRETFLTEVQQAVAIWERIEGRDLFVYDPQAEMAVNLIYTERQSIMDKLDQLEGKLSAGKISLEMMEVEFNQLSGDFESRLERFNQEVEFWNQQKGTPPAEYDRLIKEQEELEKEAEKLNQMADQLNLKVKDYNLQVGEFNRNVQDYNVITERKPEAGLYDGFFPKIDIYLTVSQAELIHTLAHEFGHALDLEHIDDPLAIMYPFSTEVITPNVKEIEILNEVCSEIRLAKLARLKLEELSQSLSELNENK